MRQSAKSLWDVESTYDVTFHGPGLRIYCAVRKNMIQV